MILLKYINKFAIILFWFLLVGFITLLIYLNNTNNLLILNNSKELKNTIKNNKSKILPSLTNDYNQRFLPSTHFIELNFLKKKINFLEINNCFIGKCHTFFLEKKDDYLFLMEKSGNLYYSSLKDFFLDKNNFIKIQTNIKLDEITDFYIKDNDIYVSGYVKSNNDNYSLEVVNSSIQNINDLNFKTIFSAEDERCIFEFPHAGKLKSYNHKGKDGILLTTRWMGKTNKPNSDNILDNNICGKVLFIDKSSNDYEIFSRGHRNIIGLYVDNNIILATENGPWGGDEINKIEYDKNYGWPIASYGSIYRRNQNDKKIYYKKSHKKFNYKEPIISFVPSIGISEIIKLPNNFSNFWQNNYLVASLNKKTLYRFKFDENFTKVLYFEEIFIGDRIRDIIYLEDEKIILLTLEMSGSIGMIKL